MKNRLAGIGLALAFVIAVWIGTTLMLDGAANQNSKDKTSAVPLLAADIKNILIFLPGGLLQELTEEETLEIAPFLADVELSGDGDQSYLDYDGVHPKMFHITLVNDAEFDFSSSNPFYIVDSEGYKSEYKLCDKISRFYWQLVKKYFQ